MVERVYLQPGEVRGLGNIVSPKTTNDFSKYNSKLTCDETGNVNGATMPLYSLVYFIAQFVVTVSRNFVADDDSLTVSVTLTENNTPVSGGSVKFYYEVIEE